MGWLKGPRTDGYIRVTDNVDFQGNVIGGGSYGQPKGALTYYVDKRSGLDSYSGKSWEGAFKTIQKAIDVQTADTNGMGDTIYVAPNYYLEDLTGTLSYVQIIGYDNGTIAYGTRVLGADASSFTGSMNHAAFRNFCFLSPGTSNKEYPAVTLSNMRYSTIDSCLFIGRDATCVEGLQISPTANNSTTANCDYSAITNNVFSTWFGTGCQLAYGIKIGYTSAVANNNYKQVWHSLIAGNSILAKTTGISVGANCGKCYGTIIRDNHISSCETGNGCASYGIAALPTGDDMHGIHVYRNTIKAVTDGIYGFSDECVFDNYVSLNGASPVAENPVRT